MQRLSAALTAPAGGSKTMQRSPSKRSLRKASRSPSLQTVWEFVGDCVDAVPTSEEALALDDSAGALLRGKLWLQKPVFGLLRLGFFRPPWAERYAVLQPADSGGGSRPPRLQLFLTDSMEELTEELVLHSPLQLNCLPSEGGHHRFTLSVANAPLVELAAPSDDERHRWMFSIGESVCPSPPIQGSPVRISDDLGACGLLGAGGRVHLGRSKVADHYSMGKVLAQGDDFLVVEGLHLRTRRSHALKLLSKRSPRLARGGNGCLQPAVCSRLKQCLEEIYEGPNHVCLVMPWGTHELDARHELSASVLEALRLLRELLPRSKASDDSLMLKAQDTQKLMMRLLALDHHLQANLFP